MVPSKMLSLNIIKFWKIAQESSTFRKTELCSLLTIAQLLWQRVAINFSGIVNVKVAEILCLIKCRKHECRYYNKLSSTIMQAIKVWSSIRLLHFKLNFGRLHPLLFFLSSHLFLSHKKTVLGG